MSDLYQIFTIKSFLASPIKALKFSKKTNSILIDQNISNFEDLFKLSANDLLKSDQTDDRCLTEIDSVLSALLKRNHTFNMSSSEKIKALDMAFGKSLADIPIEQFGLSIWSENCMRSAKIKTFGDLSKKTYLELLQIKNLGSKIPYEIVEKLVKKFNGVFDIKLVRSKAITAMPLYEMYKVHLIVKKLKSLSDLSGGRVLVIDLSVFKETGGNSFAVPTAYMETSIDGVPFNKRIQDCLQKLNIRNLGDLSKLKIPELMRIKNIGRRSIEEINNTLNKYYEELNTKSDIEKESLGLSLSRIKSCLSDKEYYVLKGRLEGLTLKEIGVNLNVSRERIRQVETKAIKRLNKNIIGKRLISLGETIVKILKKYDGMANFFEVLQEMDGQIDQRNRSENIKDLRRLMKFLEFVEKKEFFEIKDGGPLKLSLYSESELEAAYRVLLEEINDYIGSTKTEIRDGLSLEIEYNQKIEDYCIEKFLKKDGIYECGKLIGRKNKPVVCMEYLYLSAGKPLGLKKGFELFKAKFDNSISRRNADSYVSRAKNLMLWGWGVYIHQNLVDLRLDQSHIIFERINQAIQNKENKISAQSIFINNKPLMKYIGFPTSYALYSWLRSDAKETYLLRKFPDIESPILENSPRKQRDEEVNEYFLKRNEIVFRDELINYFVNERGFLEHQMFFAMQRCPAIYKLGNERFVHKQLLNLTENNIRTIRNTVEQRLNNHSYLILGQLIADEILPTISKCVWTNYLLADILKKHTKLKIVGKKVAVTLQDNNLINNVEDIIKDIVENAGHDFTKSSLTTYCRLNNVTKTPIHISKFVSKYGFLLKT